MKKVKEFLKNQVSGLMFAVSSVEKNALGQEKNNLTDNIGSHKRVNEGTLVDSLLNGVITKEVQEMRWKMYKVLNAANDVSLNHTSTDEEGYKTFEASVKSSGYNRLTLSKIKVDEHDTYPLEFVISNDEVTIDTNSVLYNPNMTELSEEEIKKYAEEKEEQIKILKERKSNDKNKNIGPDNQPNEEYGDGYSTDGTTIAEISNEDYQSFIKSEKPIKIIRDHRPMFDIEKYTSKLNVRTINGKDKLLEFYISKYPNEDDKKTTLFLSELKRVIKNPNNNPILDILTVRFTTYNCIGVDDFLEFSYDIKSFDKVIEFDGNYVFKFIAEANVNGDNILEKYRVEYLDEKYNNKEARKK